MALQTIDTITPADDLKTAGDKINDNKIYLNDKIETEEQNRSDATAACLRIDELNEISLPILQINPVTETGLTLTPNMTIGCGNFWITNTGSITIANPINIQSGDVQTGFILTQSKNITWGDKYIGTYKTPKFTPSYMWFKYFVIDSNNILRILVQST